MTGSAPILWNSGSVARKEALYGDDCSLRTVFAFDANTSANHSLLSSMRPRRVPETLTRVTSGVSGT